MESNQEFDLSCIIQSFDDDLSRVANPAASRGHDYFGYYAHQIRQCLDTLSKEDIVYIISATEGETTWRLSRDAFCNKFDLSASRDTEKGIILKIFVSLMASAARKKILIFNGVYAFKLGLGITPEINFNGQPFLFCFSKFAIELYYTGSSARYGQSREFLKLDWEGVESQHVKLKTWLKSTLDMFSYMCAYGIETYGDINPVTINDYRISRANNGLGALSYLPVLKFIDGKYSTSLSAEAQETAQKVKTSAGPQVKRAVEIGYGNFKLLTNLGSRKKSCESINEKSVVLEPLRRKRGVEIESYKLELDLLRNYLPQVIDNDSKWAKSQLDYLHGDESEKNTIKARETSLRYLNAYLFDYLPYFFSITDTVFQYPETPEQFLAHVFVKKSKVMDEFITGDVKKKIYPLSLLDFITLCTEEAGGNETKGNNLLRDTLAVISRYFTFIVSEYSAVEGYRIQQNPLSATRKRSGSKYSKSSKEKFDFHYWIYFRHFIKVVAKHAVLHAATTLKNEIKRFELKELSAEIDSIEQEVQALINRSNAETTISLTKTDKHNQKTISINEQISFTDELLPLLIIQVDISALTTKKVQLTKMGLDASVMHYQTLLALAVSCYAGQRASNANWLCADTFDRYYQPNEQLSDDALVDVHIFTDKVKPGGIESKLPKDIMDLLLIARRLRALNKNKSITEPIHYQNHKNSKKEMFRPLLQTSNKHRVEHYNLTPFIEMFEKCLSESSISFDSTLSYSLVNMRLAEFNYLKKIDSVPFANSFKIRNYPDSDFVPFSSVTLKSELTVHSLRKQLDSVLDVMVNDREVIRMFTGQSDAVIGYYAENTPEEEQEIRDSVKTLMPELVTPIMAQIDEKEALESKFSGTFNQDYMPISTHITTEIGAGIADIETSDALAFNWTHICPFDNNCPNEVVAEIGRMNCSICPKAVLTKHHGPAIASKTRSVLEDIYGLHERKNESGVSKADLQRYTFEIGTKVKEACSWKVRLDLLNDQNVSVLDAKGVLANMTYLKPGTFKHSLSLQLKENENSPALQSDKIRKIADRLSRKLIKAIPELPNLIDFSNERFDDNPVTQALNTLKVVAEYQNTTVEKLLEAPIKNEAQMKTEKELLGVFE